eukprot:g42974.t1
MIRHNWKNTGRRGQNTCSLEIESCAGMMEPGGIPLTERRFPSGRGRWYYFGMDKCERCGSAFHTTNMTWQCPSFEGEAEKPSWLG